MYFNKFTRDLLNYISDFLLTYEWINWSLVDKELYQVFHLHLLKDKVYRRKNFFKLSKYWRKYFDAYCYYTYVASSSSSLSSSSSSASVLPLTSTTTTTTSTTTTTVSAFGITFSYGRYQNFTKRDLKQWLHFFIHFNHPNHSWVPEDHLYYNNNKHILNPIRVLNIDHNKQEFNSDGIQWLGHLLQFSSTMSYLQVLQLHDCNLTDASLEVLCNSLSARKDASSLEQMYLSANEITSASMKYFLDRNKVQNKLPKLTLLDLSGTLVNNDTCQMIYHWYNNDNDNDDNNNNQETTTDRNTTTFNANAIEYIYLRDCSFITEIGIEMLNRIKSTNGKGNNTIQKIPIVYLHNSGCQEFDQEWFTNPSLVFT